MDSVTISTRTYDSYASLEVADEYLDVYSDSGWSSLSDDDKSRLLVRATRYIDRLPYGRTVSDHAFPVTSGGEIPPDVVSACCEMAVILHSGYDPYNKDPQTKRTRAGQVEIEYFRDSGVSDSTRSIPDVIISLIGRYMSFGYSVSTVYGSDFDDSYDDGNPMVYKGI